MNTSQIARLGRRAKTRDEEARVETKNQQKMAANANIEAEKTTTYTEKATPEAKKANIMLKKLNILMNKQRSYC